MRLELRMRELHPITILVFVALVAGLAPATGAAAQEAQPTQPMSIGAQSILHAMERSITLLDGPVESFSVSGVDLPTAVKILSNTANVLCGIEQVPWQTPLLTLVPVAVEAKGETARELLDQLVTQDPRYVWLEDNGYVNLVVRAAYESSDYPLNAKVADFSVKDLPYAVANWQILGLQQQAGGLPWGGGLRHGHEEGPQVTIALTNATIRGLLDEVGRQTKMSWEISYSSEMKMLLFLMTPRFPAPLTALGSQGSLSTAGGGSVARGGAVPKSSPTVTLSPDRNCCGSSVTAAAQPTAPQQASRLVALRPSLTPHGFGFKWDSREGRVWASDGKTRLVVAPREARASVNGSPVQLPAAPVLERGRLLVPYALVDIALSARPGPRVASLPRTHAHSQ